MKLTVSIVTFQHADTIRQAMTSVLEQKTDFPFEIVVGDDASTDGTRAILEEFRARAPDIVRPILHETNAGDRGLSNVMSTVDAARGEYIAFLDGDDYWTDPLKLQKQVDFLDAHPDCMVCAHYVEHLRDGGARMRSAGPPAGRGLYDVGALVVQNFAPKISTVIRTSGLASLPEWYRRSTIVSNDWLLNVMVGRAGRVGFIDDVMAVHRLGGASVTLLSGADRMLTDKLQTLALLRDYLPNAQRDIDRAERRVRWKLRFVRWSPAMFARAKVLYGRMRSRGA